MEYEQLKDKVLKIIGLNSSLDDKLNSICIELKQNISYYDWVGFYFADPEQKILHLTHFAGKPTEHTKIPFGKGICGQVAVSNQNFVVQDVTEQDNYISCGLDVKSEIVIPIFKDGNNVGQIDIDSHHIAPFTKKDEDFLEFVCQQVAFLL